MNDRFESIKWTEEQSFDARQLKYKAQQLEALILSIEGNERYTALALTALEQCIMWANKGIGR